MGRLRLRNATGVVRTVHETEEAQKSAGLYAISDKSVKPFIVGLKLNGKSLRMHGTRYRCHCVIDFCQDFSSIISRNKVTAHNYTIAFLLWRINLCDGSDGS